MTPIRINDWVGQTEIIDTLDEFNQTDFDDTKKSQYKWWQYLIVILVLLIVFVGIGLAIGYGVGWFGKSKLRCNDGFVEIDNLCHAVSTTAAPVTTEPCDGCNCPMDILLDPGTDPTTVITSPRYQRISCRELLNKLMSN